MNAVHLAMVRMRRMGMMMMMMRYTVQQKRMGQRATAAMKMMDMWVTVRKMNE